MADIRITGGGGLDALLRKLQASTTSAPRGVTNAVREATDQGVQVAKREAPVDTGRLESEIYGTSSALSGLVMSPAPYSGFQNFGTSRVPPNEYMGRTARAVEADFLDRVEAVGRDIF